MALLLQITFNLVLVFNLQRRSADEHDEMPMPHLNDPVNCTRQQGGTDDCGTGSGQEGDVPESNVEPPISLEVNKVQQVNLGIKF